MDVLSRICLIALALGASATGAVSTSRNAMPVEQAAQQVPTDALVTNIVSLFLFEEHCLPSAGFDPAILKAAINRFANVGEAQVGRQIFRTLVVDDLSSRRGALRTADSKVWCAQLAPELVASGLARPTDPAQD